MCGRFTLKATPTLLASHFEIPALDFEPRYNIAPTQMIPAVRCQDGARTGVFLRWGLVPSWAKDKKIGNTLINARAETVAEKPSFRSAFKKRRCLIPASGFYEWKKEGTKKQPFLIGVTDEDLFAFAGLWEVWKDEDGTALETCTILTTSANDFMAKLHDRMPVILPPASYKAWLAEDATKDDLLGLLGQVPSDQMSAYPVSTLVNSPKNDRPECLTAV